MDDSKVYIKMCEKAVEIQHSRPPIMPLTLYRTTSGFFEKFRKVWDSEKEDWVDQLVVI